MVHKNIVVLLCFFALLSSCMSKRESVTDLAEKKAEGLWEKVEKGDAEVEFPLQYFPKAETEALLNGLRNDCSFKKSYGKLSGKKYFKDLATAKEVVKLSYEFLMPCDSVRFILTYNVNQKTVELFEMKLEPVEQHNSMLSN